MIDDGLRPLVLDFGMHEGEDTEFYLECGARVVAFEANEELVNRNKNRFEKEIASGHLEIVSGAIVPPDFVRREQTFYVDSQKSVWGTTSVKWAERNSGLGSQLTAITVPAIDLKGILKSASRILYVKIDIEGADRFVLDTFKLIGLAPEFISVESDKLDFQAVVDEIETLQSLGYSRFAAVQQATIPGSRVRGRRLDGGTMDYRFRKHASGTFGPYLKQPYKTAGEVLEDYRSIFRAYARYGDQSWPMRFGPTRCMTRAINFAILRAFKSPLCGWYDTHAAR
jgi:FkbM family methyltransferase